MQPPLACCSVAATSLPGTADCWQCMTSPSLASWHHGHRILHRDPPRHPRHRSVDSVDSATRAEKYIYTGAPKSLEVLKSSGKYIRKDKVVLKLRENGQNYK